MLIDCYFKNASHSIWREAALSPSLNSIIFTDIITHGILLFKKTILILMFFYIYYNWKMFYAAHFIHRENHTSANGYIFKVVINYF